MLQQGSPQNLGRAFAKPELKFVEEPYGEVGPLINFTAKDSE